MRQEFTTFDLQAEAPGLHDFTDQCARWVAASGIRDGLLTLFCRHTSASLLIDRKGVVRHVHPGGVFAKDSPDPQARRDYADMRAAVEALVAEKETSR